ncbi:MAG: hypothetical protein V1744_04850 [Candidatus Altiarchaeota archaeon]
MKKAQIFTVDMIFGVMIFLVLLAITVHLWESAYGELRWREEDYERNWLAETVSEQLVRTSGDPPEWSLKQPFAYGLAQTVGAGQNTESRVLDADKIFHLINDSRNDYDRVRNNLLGSSRYDFYLELSCVNRTDLGCLQGLSTDSINLPVYCIDKDDPKKSFRINIGEHHSYSYLWFEAEDLFGNKVPCSKPGSCSGGDQYGMSLVREYVEAKVRTDPGKYNIWVRLASGAGPTISLNGVEHQVPKVSKPVGWSYAGWQELRGETTIGIRGDIDADPVDAILLTDSDYNPGVENPKSFGNPNIHSVCAAGNLNSGSDIVSASKTAVIGVPATLSDTGSGTQLANDKVLEIKVIIWGGNIILSDEGGPGGPPTTTQPTQPPEPLVCLTEPPTEEMCIQDGQSNMLITGVDPPNAEITCGQLYSLTVHWTGSHSGDPNYFGFFLGDDTLVGACQTMNPLTEETGKVYNYDMQCMFLPMASGINMPDEQTTFTVTGKDFGGYCLPNDINRDTQYQMQVDVKGCMKYIALGCISTGHTKVNFKCDFNDNGQNSVDKVYDVIPGNPNLECNVKNDITVHWSGTHSGGLGEDNSVYWTYLLKKGNEQYCIGTCQSTPQTPETEKQYYEMTCSLLPTEEDCGSNLYSPSNGEYDLYIIAETYGGYYCDVPGQAEAYGVGKVTINNWNCEATSSSTETSSSSTSTETTSSSSSSSSTTTDTVIIPPSSSSATESSSSSSSSSTSSSSSSTLEPDDYCSTCCATAGNYWNKDMGDCGSIGCDYYSLGFEGGTDPHCCGDDAGEYRRWLEWMLYGVEGGDQYDSACCNLATDCAHNSVCYASGTHSHDADANGDNDYCYQGTWHDCYVDSDCKAYYVCNADNDCIYDNFDDNSFNVNRWEIFGCWGCGDPPTGLCSATEVSQEMKLRRECGDENSGSSWRYLYTKSPGYVTGDFDVYVDWTEATVSNYLTSSSIGELTVETGHGPPPDETRQMVYIGIAWDTTYGGLHYRRSAYDNATQTWNGQATVPTSDTSGRLRITRVNGVVRTYHASGTSSNWVELGTPYNTGSNVQARPRFELWFDKDNDVTVKYDNINIIQN